MKRRHIFIAAVTHVLGRPLDTRSTKCFPRTMTSRERLSSFRLPLIVALSALVVGGLSDVASGGLTAAAGRASAPSLSSVSCAKGSKRAVIGGKVKCLRSGQACAKRYQAAYRKYGFSCVSGHLKKLTPALPPPPPPLPPPPPPPPAPHGQPGHYKGLTSQITNFEFDVTADGNFVTHLVTGQINEGCSPGGSLYGGDLNFGEAKIPIATDGSFTIDDSYQSTVDENPSTGHLTIVGHMSGSTATGTLSDNVSFSQDGTPFSCGSGLQTWTVTRTG
ncbi:MAG: hypothetical protein QOF27_2787 [Gaiellaceae bacterium]|jgi:hypothetical protein|nr:hypothetical protein [Gaiellaceae bacterium]